MKRRIMFFISVFIIICSICFIKTTNSRYLSEVNIDGNIDVAVPQIVLDTSNCVSSSTILPGGSQTYDFYVKNYTDSKINEVLMQYYINVNITKSNIPLTYKIYEVSENSENELTQATEGFGPMTLNYETQEEKHYKLVFTWDENDNNISYANNNFAFQISANTIQVYEQTVTSEEISINAQGYSDMTATLQAVTDVDNTFDVTVTNSNPYEIKYKIIEENDLYNVEYDGSTDTYATIGANTTDTIRVVFSGKDDVVYENMESDSVGNLYKSITIVLDSTNPYDAEQVQIATNQTIYLEKSIKNNLIAKAGEIVHYEEGHTFTGVSESNEANLCSIEDPVSGETIYFYRGSVTDNYVSFAGYTWRILRINSDGSLRLILDSTISTSQYQTSNTPTENTIESAIELINWEDSTPYSTLHAWYNSNIATDYGDKIVETKFVFDTTYNEQTASSTSASCYYFGPYLRVGADGNSFSPTFSYTDESLVTDNIGLITADELLYAGAYFRSSNTSFFLYNSSISTACWTMSPSFWDNSAHYKAGMMIFESNGKMHDWPDDGNTLTSALGLRPVISIRGDLEMSGEGTSSNPYKY